MSSAVPQLENIPVMETGMLIRKPANEVFEAIVDPAITTKFWFTDSTGRLEPGAEVRWTWSMYDLSSPVKVKEFEQDRRLVVEWGDEPAVTTVEWTFDARDDGTTFVSVKETGYKGDTGDEIVGWAIGSMGGFTQALAGLKALLEHKIQLGLTEDRFPDGHPA
jgi:uncharacterized protein YndB with AHSA1/START domain